MSEVAFFTVGTLLAYTYVGYWLALIFVSRLLPERRSHTVRHQIEPRVSIIIAAHNEEEFLAAKIENCLSLHYPSDKLEILIGSDGSSDATESILRATSQPCVQTFVFRQRRGKMATVNRLVRHASGEVCVFSDVSELFDSDAIRRLVQHFADPTVGAVTGNHVVNQSGSAISAGSTVYWNLQRRLQMTESELASVYSCDGTIYACRRELFPFPPEDTINDDMAVPLGIRARNKRIVFDSQAIVRGDALGDTKRLLWQKVRGQAGRYQVFHRHLGLLIARPTVGWWIFLSHHVLPVVSSWLLVPFFLLNVHLAFTSGMFYQLILGGHVAFYFLAGLGYLGQRFGIGLSHLSFPYYFVTANIGSLLGFFAYLRQSQSPAWRKVD